MFVWIRILYERHDVNNSSLVCDSARQKPTIGSVALRPVATLIHPDWHIRVHIVVPSPESYELNKNQSEKVPIPIHTCGGASTWTSHTTKSDGFRAIVWAPYENHMVISQMAWKLAWLPRQWTYFCPRRGRLLFEQQYFAIDFGVILKRTKVISL